MSAKVKRFIEHNMSSPVIEMAWLNKEGRDAQFGPTKDWVMKLIRLEDDTAYVLNLDETEVLGNSDFVPIWKGLKDQNCHVGDPLLYNFRGTYHLVKVLAIDVNLYGSMWYGVEFLDGEMQGRDRSVGYDELARIPFPIGTPVSYTSPDISEILHGTVREFKPSERNDVLCRVEFAPSFEQDDMWVFPHQLYRS